MDSRDAGRGQTAARRHAAERRRRSSFSVADEGVGIAPEEMDGIFQPFRGGFDRGTGLGLSIVHRIVTDYSGEVPRSARQGTGTTVV